MTTIENFLQAFEHPLVMFICLGIAAVAMLLVLAVARASSGAKQVQNFDDALRSIAASELDIDTNLMPVEQEAQNWGEYWYNLTTQTGRIVKDPSAPGRVALGIALFGAAVGLFAFPGGIFGLLSMPIGMLALYRLWLGAERNKRVAAIDKQLPSLLAGLRANLSAQSTPQQALMDVADDMPAPLGDELRALKRDINVNIGLDMALTALGDRVSSREVKFLVSSIQIAVRNGADLEPQIATIQDIVSQRTRIRQKLRAAVAQVKPTQYLALLAVPFMFVVSCRTKEQRDYWFGDGILFLFIGIALYAAGAIAIKLMIKSVEDT